MMSKELSEIKRYELKYTITEELAAQIREHIKHICTYDIHVPPGEQGYIVNNLYFDTPDLRFYYDTKFRKLTRYKPRARFYGEKATDLIWPEIKYRNASVIWKRRYCIPVTEWPNLFHPGLADERKPMVKPHLDTFDDLIYWYGAQPVLHVRYFREPYVTELEEYGRVTFDRQLCCRPTHGSFDLNYDEQEMIYYDDPMNARSADSPVILEIKVETLIPIWAIELIRKFNLQQRGFSKYCYGIESIFGVSGGGRTSIFD
ncbi:MAG: polyphosphate polymerase domain-containing protein [candidate division KSB1 bacterium]|nr:polyphosphate polymerase domain-containing protein [candidate division KSB1 bacterium]MDZ7401947.1 polyphosphate polymerase domain-containing protein [candidate division KSB1 bacterium]